MTLEFRISPRARLSSDSELVPAVRLDALATNPIRRA